MTAADHGESEPLNPEQINFTYGSAQDHESHVPKREPSLLNTLLPCLALWCLAFIANVDTTIVAMLMGNISSYFKAAEKASWLGSTYLLSVCCTSPLYGRLCDTFGQKRSFTLAVCIFTVGTVCCGAARSMNELLLARTLAGMGGGGLSTIASVIMSSLVPLRSRGIYQGLTNIMFGLGGATGAPLGGILLDRVGWRGCFFMQVPALLFSLFLIFTLLERDEATHFAPNENTWTRIKSVDIFGLLTYTMIHLSALIALDLVSTRNMAVTSGPVLGCMASVVVSLILFIYCESRAKMPLISFEVLSLRSAWSSLWGSLFLTMAYYGYNFHFPLYFQVVGQMSPSDLGLRMIPAGVTIGVASLAAGLYIRKHGRYYKFCLSLIFIACLACVPMSFYRVDPPKVTPFVLNVLMTMGQSSYLVCTLVALIHTVRPDQIGVATGMSYLFRSAGQVLGVVLSGGIFQITLLRELQYRILGPGSDDLISQLRHDSTLIPELPAELQSEAIASYANSLHLVFILVNLCYVASLGFFLFVEDAPVDEHPRNRDV
ncbi:hypothetical protein MCAP1_002934 [Malassezia caprae]|uniref:Major facilitator superfamily (MFS) profile domain-containing protein n=1 Tax=Malassezia caprae TaxID=1381934 RepID=A0AAF0E7T8_9BASI|nr:hypothetical protein MCAP1_002934 [Malassezia caprae]